MKQRIVKFAAALLAALCLLALLPVQASAIHMNIRVAVKGKCPPYHFWDGDTAMGLNIDILELMAEKEGLNVEYVSYTTSSDAADALLSGEVDAVLGVLSAAACPEGTRLTNVISSGTISLIAPNNVAGKITVRNQDKQRYPVAFELGTIPFSQLNQLKTQYTVVTGDQVQLFNSVIAGNVAAVAAVKESFLYQLKDLDGYADSFTVVNNYMGTVSYAIMVRQNDTVLYEKLNRSITQLRNSGEYDAILERWIVDENLEAAQRRIQKLLIIIALLLLSAGCVVLFYNIWNRRLQQVVQEKTAEIRQQILQLEAGNRLRNLLIYEFPNSILLVQQNGEVLMMNPRAERVGGIASVAWDEPHEPVLMQDLAVFRDIWAIGSQSGLGEMESSVVLPVINKNGQQKQYRYQYFTLNEQKDCALLVEDVTEEENRRSEIYEANKNQTLNRLIAGIAHEIKNPLMSIQAFASIIREQGNDKDFQESFDQYVPQEVGRINRLIESLINYAKPVNGIKERVDAQRLTNECVYLVSASVKNKQITFSCHNAVSAYIQVNRDQIKQALLNLLINSIESVEERLALESDSRPSILVTVVKENGTVRISVRDEGTGMNDESIQNCIEPFYTTKKTGTGMGLSLAKQFVTENGGQFHLTSQLDVYTEISMLFKEDIQE